LFASFCFIFLFFCLYHLPPPPFLHSPRSLHSHRLSIMILLRPAFFPLFFLRSNQPGFFSGTVPYAAQLLGPFDWLPFFTTGMGRPPPPPFFLYHVYSLGSTFSSFLSVRPEPSLFSASPQFLDRDISTPPPFLFLFGRMPGQHRIFLYFKPFLLFDFNTIQRLQSRPVLQCLSLTPAR